MLRRFFSNVREACWVMIHEQYPEEKTKYVLSMELVNNCIERLSRNREKVTVLDAGCGHKSKITHYPHVTYIGTDIVFEDVGKNEDVDLRFVSDLDRIPLKENSVDIVFSNMVVEHLKNPSKHFYEIYKILKPGGYIVYSTPCTYNIVVALNRLLPDMLSKKMGVMLTGAEDDDIFRTFYRANSKKKLRAILRTEGFVEVGFTMYQPPPYAFVFSKLVCWAVIRYYRLLNKYDRLDFLRGVIIAQYQKESS